MPSQPLQLYQGDWSKEEVHQSEHMKKESFKNMVLN